MPIRARLTPRAVAELNEAGRWIAQTSPPAARALRQAVRAATQMIGEHPKVGVERPDLAHLPYRFLVVRGFPYLLVYDPTTQPPSIVRIVHGARDLPELLKEL